MAKKSEHIQLDRTVFNQMNTRIDELVHDFTDVSCKWQASLQQLAEANARLEGKWISVEERRPESEDVVAICMETMGLGVRVLLACYSHRNLGRQGKWYSANSMQIVKQPVTYWQPLPAPPTTATEGNEHADR